MKPWRPELGGTGREGMIQNNTVQLGGEFTGGMEWVHYKPETRRIMDSD